MRPTLLFLTFTLSLAALAGTGPNLALGRPYTSSSAADAAYPDAGAALTDGVSDPTGTFTNPAWQGRLDGVYRQTVDLGSNQQVEAIATTFLRDVPSGIAWPANVTFAWSLDDSTFVSLGAAVPKAPNGNVRAFAWQGQPVTARFLRMIVTSAGGWTFEDELQALAPASAWAKAPCNLAYARASLLASVGAALIPDAPVVTGSGLSWSVTPALPTGLNLDPGTGVLSGTPRQARAEATYTVTASNAKGQAQAALDLTVAPADGLCHPRLLRGSFLQIYDVQYWRPAQWDALFTHMKAAGISDHVIWQWTCEVNDAQTYYPTRMPGFTAMPGMTRPDPVGDSLAAAQAAGMKVWLGLSWNDDWWTNYANDKTWLDAQVAVSTANAQELWNRYGCAYGDTLAGFYLPMEVDNDNFATAQAQNHMKAAFKTLADYVHGQCGGKPVMTAPFCADTAAMAPAAFGQAWSNILAAAPLDIIALQDGCGASDDGVTTHTTTATVGAWFQALRQAIDSTRPCTQLWSDLETYEMDAQGNGLPAAEARLEAQIAAESPYVTAFTTYATVTYQDATSGHAASYKAYQTYAKTLSCWW